MLKKAIWLGRFYRDYPWVLAILLLLTPVQTLVQALDQSPARNEARPQRRDVEFCGQDGRNHKTRSSSRISRTHPNMAGATPV